MSPSRALLRERIRQAEGYAAALSGAARFRRTRWIEREIAAARLASEEASAAIEQLAARGAPHLVVVVPCGGRKRPHASPAGEMYVGSYHRACRRYAERVGADRVLILSARHGLVGLDEVIEPYDLRMGQAGSMTGADVRRQAQELDLLDADAVLLGGREYAERGLAAWPAAFAPGAGCTGIGEQLARMKQGPDDRLAAADAYRLGWVCREAPDSVDALALDAIAHWLRDPDWGVGMLEDIAAAVAVTGRSLENETGDATWDRH